MLCAGCNNQNLPLDFADWNVRDALEKITCHLLQLDQPAHVVKLVHEFATNTKI